MYTLYWSPGSASLAPHGALEETGAKYDLKLVSVDASANRDPAYLKLNPHGKVPTLVVDDKFAMYECAAIAMYVADRHPEAKLAPGPDEMARGHYYQWMTHLTNSVQSAALRYYYPDRITDDAGGVTAVAGKATEEVGTLWGRVEQHLAANGPYLLGARFSAADILAYMLSSWQQCCPNAYERFPNLKRLADLVAARPAMQRVIQKNAAQA